MRQKEEEGSCKALNHVFLSFPCVNNTTLVDMSIVEVSPDRQWYAEYLIVVSGNSPRHLYAMAKAVVDAVCKGAVEATSLTLNPQFRSLGVSHSSLLSFSPSLLLPSSLSLSHYHSPLSLFTSSPPCPNANFLDLHVPTPPFWILDSAVSIHFCVQCNTARCNKDVRINGEKDPFWMMVHCGALEE